MMHKIRWNISTQEWYLTGGLTRNSYAVNFVTSVRRVAADNTPTSFAYRVITSWLWIEYKTNFEETEALKLMVDAKIVHKICICWNMYKKCRRTFGAQFRFDKVASVRWVTAQWYYRYLTEVSIVYIDHLYLLFAVSWRLEDRCVFVNLSNIHPPRTKLACKVSSEMSSDCCFLRFLRIT